LNTPFKNFYFNPGSVYFGSLILVYTRL